MSEKIVDIIGKMCVQSYFRGQSDAVDSIIDMMKSINMPVINIDSLLTIKQVFEKQNIEEAMIALKDIYSKNGLNKI